MSRIDAEPARESSRTVTVVGLSLLILTVIGALFGYVLGLRDIDENKSTAGDVPSAVPSGTASRAPGPARQIPCPQFINTGALKQDPGASVPMVQVQYVRTSSTKEAWICRERDGSGLWYQGHDRIQDWYQEDGGGEIPEEGKNGLLRPNVTEDAKNRSYSVVNDGTTYTVTPRTLTIGGKPYNAIQSYPPA